MRIVSEWELNEPRWIDLSLKRRMWRTLQKDWLLKNIAFNDLLRGALGLRDLKRGERKLDLVAKYIIAGVFVSIWDWLTALPGYYGSPLQNIPKSGCNTLHDNATDRLIFWGMEVELMRDEIYCQLIKMTTRCNDPKVRWFAWRLFYNFSFCNRIPKINVSNLLCQ